MKYLRRFHEIEPVDMNEGIKDIIGKIFTSDQDKTVNKIFNEIKYSFDPESVLDIDEQWWNERHSTIQYRLKNGDTLRVRDVTYVGSIFSVLPRYTVEVDGKKIDCSFLYAKKLYDHLDDYVRKMKKLNQGPAGELLAMGIMKRLPDSLNTSQKIDQVIEMTSRKAGLDKRIIQLVNDRMTRHKETPVKLMSWIRAKFPREYEAEFGKDDMAADMGDLGF